MNVKEKIEELLRSVRGRYDYRSASNRSRTAPQRFTEVCQERRDIPLRAWPVCVERRMGG